MAKDKRLKGGYTLISKRKYGRTIYLLLSPSSKYVMWKAYDLTDLCKQLEHFFRISVFGETPRKRFNKIIKSIKE
jgi:hypothetical protein